MSEHENATTERGEVAMVPQDQVKGVRSITDMSVAEADMSLAMASDVIDIVLAATTASRPAPAEVEAAVAAERERIAVAIEAEKFPTGPGGAFGPSTRTWDEALGAAARIARTPAPTTEETR